MTSCNECKNEISETAVSCPKCGNTELDYTIKLRYEKFHIRSARILALSLAAIIIISAHIFYVYNTCKHPNLGYYDPACMKLSYIINQVSLFSLLSLFILFALFSFVGRIDMPRLSKLLNGGNQTVTKEDVVRQLISIPVVPFSIFSLSAVYDAYRYLNFSIDEQLSKQNKFESFTSNIGVLLIIAIFIYLISRIGVEIYFFFKKSK